MKTVFVVGARGIPDVEGGVEKSAERLFPRLAAKGWRITLAGLENHIRTAEFCGVKLWSAPSFRVLKTDKLIYYVAALFHAIRIRPDIVHLAGLGAALLLFAYKLLGCKIVVRYGSADYVNAKWGIIGKSGFLLAEYQLRFADAVIAVTPALARRLKAKSIVKNISIVPNALDGEQDFVGAEEILAGGSYVLAVGRITAQKNYHRLIQAFRIFARSNPGKKLVIAGSMDDTDYLKKLKPHLCSGVIFLGPIPRSNLRSFFENASIYINCSLHEGHSNAVLEAIGFRCPILLSDIIENRDFELDTRHYFDPCDPESIATAMDRCSACPADYVVSKKPFLSWDEVARQTAEIYEGLFAEPAHALEKASKQA